MKKFIFTALVLFANLANASSYLTGSIGLPTDTFTKDFLFVAGGGTNVNSLLSIEADYRNLNKISGATGRYFLDPTLSGSTCATTPCNHQTEKASLSVDGIALTAIFKKSFERTFKGETTNIDLFFRLGGMYSKYEYIATYEAPIQPNPALRIFHEGISPLYGIGFAVGNLTVELDTYKNLIYWSDKYKDITTLRFGFRYPLN
jgi:hypothetical protein